MPVKAFPYAKRNDPAQEGEIVRVHTEKGNGDSRYWGGNEDEDSLIVKVGDEEMQLDFIGTEHEDELRLLNGLPILAIERETRETYYIIKRTAI